MSANANTVYVGTRGKQRRAGSLAHVVQGSTKSLHTITVQYADDTTYDLTGKTITGTMRRNGETFAITGTLAIPDATKEDGIFTWDKSAADVGTPGTFAVQFVITEGAEDDATFPAAMTVEPRGEATNVIPGDVIDGGSAFTTPLLEIDGGDAEGA